jgi:hypothetical protein
MAAQLRKESMVHKLLRCEANIGIKNKRNETPIAFITPSAMEEFLDECLQDYGIITDDNFQLTFKYSFLGPPLSLCQDQTGSNRIKHENESSGDELDTLKIIEDKAGMSLKYIHNYFLANSHNFRFRSLSVFIFPKKLSNC